MSETPSSAGGDVRWMLTSPTSCPSLTRSVSFEPYLTDLERTKNQRNTGIRPSLPADHCKLPAANAASTQPAVSADTKTTESTVS